MNIRHRGDAKARVIQVIEVQDLRGDGSDEDPMRTIYAYYTLEGKVLAEHDPHNGALVRWNPYEDGPLPEEWRAR